MAHAHGTTKYSMMPRQEANGAEDTLLGSVERDMIQDPIYLEDVTFDSFTLTSTKFTIERIST